MNIPEINELTGNPEVRRKAEHIGKHLDGERYGVPTLSQLEESCAGDETLLEMLQEVVRYGIRYIISTIKYTSIDWEQTDRDEIVAIDGSKKHAHDAAISAINIFGRTLKQTGHDSDWISSLVTGGRPAYARFALIVGFDAIHQQD